MEPPIHIQRAVALVFTLVSRTGDDMFRRREQGFFWLDRGVLFFYEASLLRRVNDVAQRITLEKKEKAEHRVGRARLAYCI